MTHQIMLYLHVVKALAKSSVILWSVKKLFDCTIWNRLDPEQWWEKSVLLLGMKSLIILS